MRGGVEIILFSIIRVQIKRNPGRSILTVCIAMCLLLFVGAYWENVIRTENALHTLSDSIPVGGSITDISGGKQTALEISTTTADKILESGYVKNVIYTGQAAGNLEEYNRVENPKVFDTTIVGSNSCDAFSALTEETISFFEKGEENFLSTDKPLCVVSEQYAREHQIKEGETLQFPLYAIEYKQGSSSVQYRETGMAELTVIGTVPERYLGDTVMDILVPVQWLRAYIEEADLRFSYSSMNFQVKNPMKLNAFKKAMENMGLQEKSQEAMEEVYGGTLILDDTIFIENAEKLQGNLQKDIDATNEQLLDSLNLLENSHLKRAAILLFHHNPEKWIPGAYIKIGYFESDSELRYQDEIHGSLISQADKVVDLILTKYLKADISYQGVTRVETYPFPKEAIREAVFNAIAHKFYGALIPIQISVYADRIYIANDCIFPEDWTISDLMGKHRSRPYNPLIANTFFRAGFIEAWGRGIEKIKDSCKEAGNPMPEYTIKREDIMVMFKSLVSSTDQDTDRANQGNDNSVVTRILKVIQEKPSLSQKKIADVIGEKYSTVKYYMESMKKSGIIKREGSSQKGKWVIL